MPETQEMLVGIPNAVALESFAVEIDSLDDEALLAPRGLLSFKGSSECFT